MREGGLLDHSSEGGPGGFGLILGWDAAIDQLLADCFAAGGISFGAAESVDLIAEIFWKGREFLQFGPEGSAEDIGPGFAEFIQHTGTGHVAHPVNEAEAAWI